MVASYHLNTAAIQTRLAAMRAAGQDRIRIMIYHGNGISTGSVMNSAGGNLSAQHRANLTNLLADVRNAGFAELFVSFAPQGTNWPGGWNARNQARADENWSVIYNLHSIIRQTGMTYRIDVGNELMTSNSGNVRGQYIKYIWPKYWDAFHRYYYDSVGFSLAPGQIDAIDNMVSLYGQKFPVMGDVHIYPYGSETYTSLLNKAAGKFAQFGPTAGSYRFIIGEAYFNDAAAAQQLSAAINALAPNKSKPFFLLQWPVTPTLLTVCQGVSESDVSPFSNYINYGF